MDNVQRTLVQETWRMVEPIADTAATLFYDRLFTLDPALRALFPSDDLSEQKRKLMMTLGVAVRGLDDIPSLVGVLEALGRRHVGYNVEERHYDTVGSALLWTLEQGLGDAFTPEVREAWTEVYTLVATVMKNATTDEAVEA